MDLPLFHVTSDFDSRLPLFWGSTHQICLYYSPDQHGWICHRRLNAVYQVLQSSMSNNCLFSYYLNFRQPSSNSPDSLRNFSKLYSNYLCSGNLSPRWSKILCRDSQQLVPRFHPNCFLSSQLQSTTNFRV